MHNSKKGQRGALRLRARYLRLRQRCRELYDRVPQLEAERQAAPLPIENETCPHCGALQRERLCCDCYWAFTRTLP
jgi:hypothetical protein